MLGECGKVCGEVEKPNSDFVAKLVQNNIKAEADAINDYTSFLKVLGESDLSKTTKDIVESQIYEIISDELNHQERLRLLYTYITGIKTNKN